ncbi:tetratricopeptide repeat protein [Sphingomonas sp.]
MGWLALALVALGAGGLLWLLNAPRSLVSLLAAALLAGATGYALQGRPLQPAQPVARGAQGLNADPGLVTFRMAILGTRHRAPMSLADRALAEGRRDEAVRIMLDTVRREPNDASAWTGLGTMLAVHDGQQLSPAARFAFARAVAIDPKAPGPPFFLGLALLNAGQLEEARTAWQRALALSPPDAPYRNDIAERIRIVDRFAAMIEGAPNNVAAPPR